MTKTGLTSFHVSVVVVLRAIVTGVSELSLRAFRGIPSASVAVTRTLYGIGLPAGSVAATVPGMVQAYVPVFGRPLAIAAATDSVPSAATAISARSIVSVSPGSGSLAVHAIAA